MKKVLTPCALLVEREEEGRKLRRKRMKQKGRSKQKRGKKRRRKRKMERRKKMERKPELHHPMYESCSGHVG
jgi:hypothetical protein